METPIKCPSCGAQPFVTRFDAMERPPERPVSLMEEEDKLRCSVCGEKYMTVKRETQASARENTPSSVSGKSAQAAVAPNLVGRSGNNNLSYESVFESVFAKSAGFARSYRTARGVARLLEVTGWGIVVVGVLMMLIGFAAGGMLGRWSGGTTFFSRFLAMMPGAGIAIVGVWNVAFSQFLRASVDTAELTRELLKTARDKAA